MASLDEEGALVERVHKLLALAEDGSSEQESLRAMETVHRLLAAHNLTLAEVRPLLHAPPLVRRGLDETRFDPVVDLWTVQVWHATADLFFCRYFYRDEGAPDRNGRWRALRVRHSLVGTPANQVTAKVMADHFCRTVRRLARAHAAGRGGALVVRRDFERACADRLAERIRARLRSSRSAAPRGSRLPVLLGLYEAEARANGAELDRLGIRLERPRSRPPRHPPDVLAEHFGRAAAETISLALQIGAPAEPRRARPAPVDAGAQMGFGF